MHRGPSVDIGAREIAQKLEMTMFSDEVPGTDVRIEYSPHITVRLHSRGGHGRIPASSVREAVDFLASRWFLPDIEPLRKGAADEWLW